MFDYHQPSSSEWIRMILIFQYTITKSELETRTLWITVWNSGTLGRNEFLGEVNIPLDYYQFNDTSPRWHKLQDRVSLVNVCS